MLFRNFVIEDIFEKIDTEKIKGKAHDFPESPTNYHTIPLLTAGVENQGLARFAKREQCPTILSNVISISANGANSGVAFYQPGQFAVLQDAYAIRLLNRNAMNEKIGLYLTVALRKSIENNHNWSYKAGWNRIKNELISLPVKTVLVPD